MTIFKRMRRRIYIIDVIALNAEGGSGLASWTMISNLREFYEIVFIPKYVEFKGDSLLKSIDSIRGMGLVFPKPLEEYARKDVGRNYSVLSFLKVPSFFVIIT